MNLQSLEKAYLSWPKLLVTQKKELLESTAQAFQNADIQDIAFFCLHTLGNISFYTEDLNHKQLSIPIKNINLIVQSKCTKLFSERVQTPNNKIGYFVHKKNPFIAMGPILNAFEQDSLSQKTCALILRFFSLDKEKQIKFIETIKGKEILEISKAKNCLALSGELKEKIESRFKELVLTKKEKKFNDYFTHHQMEENLFELYKINVESKDSSIIVPILCAIKNYYEEHRFNSVSAKGITMLYWYLLRVNNEIFSESVSLIKIHPPCFAHYILISNAFKKNPYDLQLFIKKAYLNFILNGSIDNTFNLIRENIELYSKDERNIIIAGIYDILFLKPQNNTLRQQLVNILSLISLEERIGFTTYLYKNGYIISSSDPLLNLLKLDIKLNSGGEEIICLVKLYGLSYAIDYLRQLKARYLFKALPDAKRLIDWSLNNEINQEEKIKLFKLAISCSGDVELIKNLSMSILMWAPTFNFHNDDFAKEIEDFIENNSKIAETYEFISSLCFNEIKVNNNINSALEIMSWESKMKVAPSIKNIGYELAFFLIEKADPELIARIIIERSLSDKASRISKSFVVEIAKLLHRSNIDVFVDKNSNIKFTKLPILYDKLPILKKCFLTLGLHLHKNNHLKKLKDLIISLEKSNETSILFPLLDIIKDPEFHTLTKHILNLINYPTLFCYLKESFCFNQFHKKMLFQLLSHAGKPNWYIPNDYLDIFQLPEFASPVKLSKLLIKLIPQIEGINEEVKIIDLFSQCNLLNENLDLGLSLIPQGFCSLGIRLWKNNNFLEAIELIKTLEGHKKYNILIPILIKIHNHGKDKNYQDLYELMKKNYNYYNITEYLKKIQKFNEFDIEIMNHYKASRLLPKQFL